jgi:tyrosine-protein kinase
MEVIEFAGILWRRKFSFLATFVLALGVALVALAIQTPQYRSTATVAIMPVDSSYNYLLGNINNLTPIYAEEVRSGITQGQAQKDLIQNHFFKGHLARILVRTFTDASIIKIDGIDPDPVIAATSADAVAGALVVRSDFGDTKIVGLNLSNIDHAALPRDPITPRVKLTLLVASVLGLGFGAGVAMVRDNLVRKIETGEALSLAAGVPCFAEVPNLRTIPSVRSPNEFVSDARYRSVAESMRDVRTSLQFSEGEVRSLVVTSPEGRHGKTTIAFGLAATFARAGAKTLLVDGDLRRGRLRELMDLRKLPGLSEVLQGFPLEDAVRPTEMPSLFVLTSGEYVDDPGELFQSEFFAVIYGLEQSYDVVVIDGPPLAPVNDSRIIARHVSSTLMVVASGIATRRQVKGAAERLSIIGAQLTAVVLNKSRAGRSRIYSEYLATANGQGTAAPRTRARDRILGR